VGFPSRSAMAGPGGGGGGRLLMRPRMRSAGRAEDAGARRRRLLGGKRWAGSAEGTGEAAVRGLWGLLTPPGEAGRIMRSTWWHVPPASPPSLLPSGRRALCPRCSPERLCSGSPAVFLTGFYTGVWGFLYISCFLLRLVLTPSRAVTLHACHGHHPAPEKGEPVLSRCGLEMEKRALMAKRQRISNAQPHPVSALPLPTTRSPFSADRTPGAFPRSPSHEGSWFVVLAMCF